MFQSIRLKTRTTLLWGFGGLLLLMLAGGISASRALEKIESREQQIRLSFQRRTQILTQLRSDVYLSGTYVRDYLFDPNPGESESHRKALESVRLRTEAELVEYRHHMASRESPAMQELTSSLEQYWRELGPIFAWTSKQRRDEGYQFFRDVVFPRRMGLLKLAGQIADVNDRQLQTGGEEVAELFRDFEVRLLFVLILLFGLGLILASFSVRQVLRLESEVQSRLDETLDARQQLQNLSARLVDAQERERRAISRELHDEVGQSLSAVLVELSNMVAVLPKDQAAPLEHAAMIRDLTDRSLSAVRNMALLLRPSMLDDLGLVPALEWQARETSRRTGMDVLVAADDVPDELPELHKTCVYRVVQEALNNAARHAEATKVRVVVRMEEGGLRISVQDDGGGFDTVRQRGLGLLGMSERVSNLNGRFEIQSSQGEGTLIQVFLPLAPRAQGAVA